MDYLDLSWANEYIRTLDGGVTYQPELMTHVAVHCLYIDNQNECIHREEHTLPLAIHQKKSVLREEDMIRFIHRRQYWSNQKYLFHGLMQFHVDMDPQTVLENVHDDDFSFSSEQCCRHYDNMPRNVWFAPSLFVFHSVNSMYVFFHQLTLVDKRATKRGTTRKKRRLIKGYSPKA